MTDRPASHPPDECVPMLAHEATRVCLRELHDAAIETRTFVHKESVGLRSFGAHGAADMVDAVLERLDAALADAQEELS